MARKSGEELDLSSCTSLLLREIGPCDTDRRGDRKVICIAENTAIREVVWLSGRVF